jgi:hypothetical protein
MTRVEALCCELVDLIVRRTDAHPLHTRKESMQAAQGTAAELIREVADSYDDNARLEMPLSRYLGDEIGDRNWRMDQPDNALDKAPYPAVAFRHALGIKCPNCHAPVGTPCGTHRFGKPDGSICMVRL